jgi:tRNA pseudouridine55 synthase
MEMERENKITKGINLIHKPDGPTSHDMVNQMRKLTGIQRVGHAGTLDPFAEGLLIILVGKEYTKRQREFLDMDKTYETVIHLGATSTTDDCTGEITQSAYPNNPPEITEIKHCIHSLIGTYEQMPPVYSAKKIQGRKAYELARKGKTPDLKPKKITINSIDIHFYTWPLLTIRTTVSSGTYIRALARDIGMRLGCGAYCEKLIRTAIGPYTLHQAIHI